MDIFNALLRGIIGLIPRIFGWAPPIVSLAILAAAAGVAMLWVFQKVSNQKRIAAVKKRVQAHLLELRVYRDEPAMMWRAQRSLFVFNLRYMALMLQPALCMLIPFSLLLVHMEAIYGRAPLPVGQPAVVTVALRTPIDTGGPEPVLTAPPGVVVESPAVRALDERQVSWRIRPSQAVSGTLRIRVNGATVAQPIEAGGDPGFVPGRSVSSLLTAAWCPDEPLIRAAGVDWVEIRYPSADVKVFGLAWNWLIWFVIISMLAALLLRKRFRVVF